MSENTKHQAPNPKEFPIPKLQTSASVADSMFGIWGLGFIWSLELGIWSFGLPLTADNLPRTTNDERSSLRLPPTAEVPRSHRRGRAHARARHRWQQRHLQRRRCGTDSSTALRRRRPSRHDLGRDEPYRFPETQFDARRVAPVAAEQHRFYGYRSNPTCAGDTLKRWRARRSAGSQSHRESVACPWRTTAARARLH